MKATFKFEVPRTPEELGGLSPEAFMAAWTEAVRKLAAEKALRLGTNVGPRAANSIVFRIESARSEIWLDESEGTDGRMAAHIHFGGPIRSHNGKTLAIPLPNESTRKYNPRRLFARELKGKVDLFKLKSRSRNELLFRRPGKGEKLEKPLFVLKEQTRSQRPRPWWPTAEEVDAATTAYFDENF